ncbi:MAG: glycosyltransferase [Ilumatobacter sp.]
MINTTGSSNNDATADDSTPSCLWWLPEFPPNLGGIGTFATSVGVSLAARSRGFTFLVCRGEPSDTTDGALRIVREPIIDRFEAGNPAQIMRTRKRITDLKVETQADLYHLHVTDPTPILHLATSDAAPAPTIITLHNEFLERFPPEPDSLMDRLLSATDIVVCCSAGNTISNSTAAPRFAHRIIAIPNGIAVDVEPLPLPNNARILAIGRLAEQKAFHRIIAAMPKVLESRPDTTLRLVGDGPERERLEAMVSDLQLGDAVSFAGRIDRAEVTNELRDAQIVVAPSEYEGLPYALLEAAAHGRPIVATDIGGIRDVVTSGVNGTLVDHDTVDIDPNGLATAVLDLLADDDIAARYAAAGRRHIEQHLSLEACVRAYQFVYRAALRPVSDVAVIIPAYNAERHLRDTLESILADVEQSQHSVQILVVDDGSLDSTRDIAASYADRGVEVFSQPNLGGAMARNTGMALTKSTYVAHFDADDIWEPGRLEALLAPLQNDHEHELDAVFAMAVEFADPDAPARAEIDTTPRPVRLPTIGIVRREAHERLGGFSHGQHNDQLSWASLALAKGLRYEQVPVVVTRRRIHATNTSHNFEFTTDTTRVDAVRLALAARRSAQRDG